MKRTNRLTEGEHPAHPHPLCRCRIFRTLFLQALYGGVDLLVVGQFAATADVSGVATGSMLMSTVTMVITGLSMGITILVGERIRAGSARTRPEGPSAAVSACSRRSVCC